MSKPIEIRHEIAELAIPEGRRVHYYGHVIRVEKIVARVKPLKIKGKVKYGSIQIILPKEAVDRPVYVIAYVLLDTEKLRETPTPRPGRLPLVRVI